MKIFFANWKTSLSGILVGTLTVLYMAGKIDLQTAFALQGLGQSLGFILSTDADRLKKLK